MLQKEHSAILSTYIKLPVIIKIFVLSIFEGPFYTGFTVNVISHSLSLENCLTEKIEQMDHVLHGIKSLFCV